MKIEKLNENQIRCTLNKHDLMDRELKLSELAYGTEKAKGLFKDMMEQAFDEFGFEAEDIPLVIEAIPVSSDCIILIVTKVEDPEELDTRFAKFSPVVDEDTDDDDTADEALKDMMDLLDVSTVKPLDSGDIAHDIMNMIKKLTEDIVGEDVTVSGHLIPISAGAKEAVAKAKATKQPNAQTAPALRIFSFDSLDEVSAFAAVICEDYYGSSVLYKNPSTKTYYLTLEKTEENEENFKKIVNIAGEYGRREKCSYATLAYFDEHYDKIVKKDAIRVMANL